MKDLLRFLRYAYPYKWNLIWASVLLMLSGLLMAAIVAFIKPLYSEVLGARLSPPSEATSFTGEEAKRPPPSSRPPAVIEKQDILQFLEKRLPMEKIGKYTKKRAFVEVPLFLILVFFIKVILGYFGQYLTLNAGLRTIMALKNDLYSAIQDQSLKFFSMNPTGVIMSRIISDVERMSKIVSMHLADSIRLIFTLLFVTVYVFYVSWKLSLVCFVALPIAIYPIVKFGQRLKRASRKSQERMGEISSVLNEAVSGIKIVKSFGMEEFEKARFKEALKRMFRVDRKIAKTVALAPNVMELIGAVVGVLLFWWAGYQISHKSLHPGDFMSFLVGAGVIFMSVKKLNVVNNEIQQASAAALRVFEMMDADVDIKEKEDAVSLPPFQHEIVFKDVFFSYGDEEVLKKIDLTVRKGEVIALVGTSGAGKTTLVNLLPRFYEVTAGAILIDGRDLRDLKVRSLRDQIGIVSQETILFNDSVRNNIAYGRPETSLDEIIRVAKIANAHDFIMELPRQYDTVLGERGERLSAGQRQRVTIARALLKDPPILILDEATSALDTASEALVQGALNILMQGRTSIVIAHRLSTVRRAHCIYVLDSARIIEKGTHKELIEMNGVYARLHAIQFRED